MKVMDRLGNKLYQGNVVYFAPLQSLVTVLEITDPGKLTDTPGSVLLGIRIPVQLDKGKTDALFAELMKVYTPEEEKVATSAVDRAIANIRDNPGNLRRKVNE